MSNPMPPDDMSTAETGEGADTLSCTCPHCGKEFSADIMPKSEEPIPEADAPDDSAIESEIGSYMES